MGPEKIENVYIQSKWVAQAFIYGNSIERVLVGIIVPDEDVLKIYCKENKINGKLLDWCKNIKIYNIIHSDLKETAIRNKLHSFEQIATFHLHPELFTPHNGTLTPTFKLKRPVLRE